MSRRESYRTSSNYTSNSYNAGISKSTKTTKTNNTGNGDNNRENYRTTTYTTTKVSAATKRRNELALKVAKEKKNAEAFKNYSYTKPTGLARFSPIAQVMDITGIGKKTFEVNKSYYERNVKGKAKPGGGFYGASIEDFKGYMSGRGSGTVDAMGRTINNRDEGGGSNYVVEKNVGGKSILTTEKKVAEDAETKTEYDSRQTKKKGRNKNILTSSKGIMKTSADYSLGKKSLLGQVV